MKALILAGGKGTRLRPLTSNIPKPLAPIANIPMIIHAIKLLKKHGFDEIIITIGYLGNQIEDLLGDGEEFGVNITYFKETRPLGTAGALKYLENQLNDSFLVISSDIITDLNLKNMYEFHKKKKSTVTIALTTAEIPVAYGIVVTNDESRITKFLEKPSWSQIFSDKINAGIYILEPEVTKFIHKGDIFDFSKQLFPHLLEQDYPMYGYTMNSYWLDIGNPEKYVQANHDVLTKKISLDIQGEEIKENVWIGEGTEIDPKVNLWGPCIIGKDCKIEEGTTIDRLSVIGNNVNIGRNVQIKRSIVLNDSTIRDHAFIENNAIVCPRAEVGSGVKIMANSVIGEDVVIGENSVIKHDMKIWPNKIIEAGSFINMNLKHGTYVKRSLFGPYGITGLVNYEFTPELMTKLGSAIGTFLGEGSKVFIGRDTMLISRMMKRAIISGLMSTGVEIYNVEALPLPVIKYVTHFNEAEAGIMLKIPYAEINSINIKIFDTNGIELSDKDAKKIEDIFFKENIKRIDPSKIKDIIPYKMSYELYREKLLKYINTELISKRRPRVVIDCGNRAGSLIAPQIFQKIGCEVISLNTMLEMSAPLTTFLPHTESISMLSKTVKALNADFGFILNEDAGRVLFVDENGEVLEGDTAVALFSKIRLLEKGGGKVVVPIHTSQIVEQVVEEYNGTIIKTKSGNRPLIASVQKENSIFGGEETGGFILPHFNIFRDGIFAAAYLTEYLVKEEKTLSELSKSIPQFFMAKESVSCPITIRGKVMLNLIEEAYDFNFNTLDGIKIFFDYGWVLIKPSAIDETFEIYAESSNQQDAEQIAKHWGDEIKLLIHEIETGI
ncbi:MAG: sugar phosphate nucleotidyltransferase [Candidatus Helarchaeota archaeon]